jgi:hypothetical protein
MERKLGRMEQGIIYVGEMASLFIVVVLRLVNGPPPEVLQRALALLQRRHPLLRMQIVHEKDGPWFREVADVGPIPVQVDARPDDGHWQTVTEAELNRKMDASAAPLMHVRYLYSTGRDAPSEIVFTCHHAAMDAASGIRFCHELLSLCGAMCAGEPLEEPAPLPLADPVDKLYPTAFQGIGRMWRTATFLVRQMGAEMGYRRRLGDGRRPELHPVVHTRILTLQIPPDATRKFVRRARQEGVTLNSGLAAAELVAVGKHLYGGEPLPLHAIAFADLRPHLKPPVRPENLGAYFAMLQYVVQMGSQRELWELAREIQQTIYRMTKHGDKFITPLLLKSVFQMMDRQKEFRMGAAGLSYATVAGLEPSYGPIRLVGLHGFIPNNYLGPEYSIFARLLFERLWLDVFFLEEDMDRDTVQTIADEITHLVGDDE